VTLFERPDPLALLSRWAGDFFTTSPVKTAVRWICTLTGRNEDESTASIARMTLYDLECHWRTLPVDPAGPPARAAFSILCDQAVGKKTTPETLVERLMTGTDPLPTGLTCVVRALTTLYPAGAWPALLVVPSTDGDVHGLRSTVRTLQAMADAEPRLPIALAITKPQYDAITADSSRLAAAVREGTIEVRSVSADELLGRLREAEVEPPLKTVELLTAGGLSDDAAETFVEAARVVENPEVTGTGPEFRSAPERFLHDQLESWPETAGLFAPNHPLGFVHGTKSAVGDLVATSLKLVVEVDGGYFHLTPDQYRRDRRKDWLYQLNGYLVLRFLAEDVVEDFGPIFETILKAVALRRARTPNGDGT
jgi:hypothetical protein